MKIAALVALPLLLALLGIAFAGEEDVLLEVHDVRDLVSEGRRLESLVGRVRAGAGEGLQTVQPNETGLLIVRGTRAALDRVRDILEEARRERMPLVTMQVWLIEVGKDRADRAAMGNAEFLDGADLLAEWTGREGVEVVSAPRLTCYDAQRAEIFSGTKVSTVVDFTVRREDGGRIVDPVVEEILSGVKIGIRPVASLDRRFVTLVLDCHLVTPMPAPDPAPLSAAPGIATREVREFRLRRSATLPDGKALLLGLGDTSGSGTRLALLVTATVFDLESDISPREGERVK